MEGKNQSARVKLWRDLARSESRIWLMEELCRLDVGFNEAEDFGLGLAMNFKSHKYKENKDAPKSAVREAMKIKLGDEKRYKSELFLARNQARRKLEVEFGKNSKTYRRILRELRDEAKKEKIEAREKYDKKIIHLRKKHKNEKEEKDDIVPDSMGEYIDLSIFDKYKFDEIAEVEFEIRLLGDVNIDKNEAKVLKLHPKLSIVKCLEENDFQFEQELAYAKARMELAGEDEEEEKLQEGAPSFRNIKTNKNEDLEASMPCSEEDKKIEEAVQESEALSRQIFDPIKKEFDDRRRRATDLKECSRVTLPRPLGVTQEAMIEMRREAHMKAFKRYREKYCGKTGEQKSNLTMEEQEGLKKLVKRIRDGEIVIMKTDKSGKFCVATRERYIELGMDHIKNDKEITREELRQIERYLNSHTAAWCIMFSSGENHDHTSRIIKSKTTNSNNVANLYLMYKDHKIAVDKTRPVATAISSNTTGLSNAVSDFLEACANSVKSPFEAISTEDMLHKTIQHNNIIEEKRHEWNRRLREKLNFRTCKFR